MKSKKMKAIKKPAPAKKSLAVKDPFTKTEIMRFLAEAACITKKQVEEVMCSLMNVIEAHISKKGPGVFTLPGVAKFKVTRKPATKARKGVNPFTGKPMTIAAKPARNIVKIKALKQIKEIVK